MNDYVSGKYSFAYCPISSANCSALPDEGALADERDGEFSGLGAYNASDGEIFFYGRNGTVAWMFKGTK